MRQENGGAEQDETEQKKIYFTGAAQALCGDRQKMDLAKKIGAAGVHVGLSDMGIEKARELLGEDFIIGGSAHNVKEALQAQKSGADYIGCGAVFGSQTKSDVTTLAKEELCAICEAVEKI